MGLFYGLFAVSVFLSFSVLGAKLWVGSYKVGIRHNGTASNISKLRGSSAGSIVIGTNEEDMNESKVAWHGATRASKGSDRAMRDQ
jgi:hypothetical protein